MKLRLFILQRTVFKLKVVSREAYSKINWQEFIFTLSAPYKHFSNEFLLAGVK